MKLPTGDGDLTEDEFEGLVSSNAPQSHSHSSPRSFRSGRSSAWARSSVSSRSVGNQKRVLLFLGFLVLVLGMIGLSHTDSEAVSLNNNTSMDPSPPDYLKENVDNGDGDGDGDDDDGESDQSEKKDIEKDNESDKPTDTATNNDKTGKEDDNDNDNDNEKAVSDDGDTPASNDKEEETSGSDNDDDGEEEEDSDENKEEEHVASPTEAEDEAKQEALEQWADNDDDADDAEEVDSESKETSNDNEEENNNDDDGDSQESDENKEEEHVAWPTEAEEEAKKEALIEQWGNWHFWDGDPDSRPTEDYMAKFPNRDCTFNEFPETAWQGDAVYVNHMLDSAGELVARAKEAIYTEYGYGPKDELTRDQLKERMTMFRLHTIDLEDDTVVESKDHLESAGWTTRKSLAGLSRRLLHAMMVNDTFTIVLGGHSAAAGHGNHFLQSYMMQMYKVLNPIFERVGVKLVVRNLAQGGLGTLQHSLGSRDIYGDNVDVLVWDSSMTETDQSMIDLFYRQALIGGKRAPLLWGGPFDLLKDLYLHADADVMVPGSAMSGIKDTIDEDQAATMPFAARYIKCDPNSHDLCEANEHRFRAQCWIDRDDVTPPTTQKDKPGGQVKWHPGFRIHQLKGRSMAMVILTVMQDAIDTWSEVTIIEGHPLEDEHWHITGHYDNIRSKALTLEPSVGKCSGIKEFFPERICTTPMNGRTEFTPRANPDGTSLRSILKPTPNGFVPKIEAEILYDGPDVPNPLLMVPEGETDVEAIVSNRRRLSEVQFVNNLDTSTHSNSATSILTNQSQHLRGRNLEEIKAGKGWELQALPGNCDGTATGICGRLKSSDCLLYGHMDERGGIIGNEMSGWLVMNVPNVTAGIIILKFEEWHLGRESTVTEGWTEVNNGEYNRALKEVHTPLPDDFMLDYAIDGEVTTLNLEQYKERLSVTERVIETLILLDDPDMKESKDIEVAFRMRNCGRGCVWKVTHLYWA